MTVSSYKLYSYLFLVLWLLICLPLKVKHELICKYTYGGRFYVYKDESRLKTTLESDSEVLEI